MVCLPDFVYLTCPFFVLPFGLSVLVLVIELLGEGALFGLIEWQGDRVARGYIPTYCCIPMMVGSQGA